jgi:DNA-binding beta-propeller fold protein YncE
MKTRMRKTWLLAVAVALAQPALGQSLTLIYSASVYEDAKEGKLKAPEGVACTDAGNVVVADSGNGRLLLFTFKDAAFQKPVEVKMQQLGRPVRVQIDSQGDVLSLDQRGRRITRVGAGGEFKGFVEPSGMPEEAGFRPVAFKLDKADNVYLLDVASSRVAVLTGAGKFQRELPLPKGEFVDVAVDGQGVIYALDAVSATVWSADKKDKAFAALSKPLKDYASFPSYIAVTERGFLLLVDSHGNGLVILGPDGSYLGRQLSIGWAEGLLYYPGQLCINAKGETFIADRNNNRVQAFTAAK